MMDSEHKIIAYGGGTKKKGIIDDFFQNSSSPDMCYK